MLLCRTFLIRDVMDEMLLNGLAPDRVFLELSIMHCMRSSRIGDCFFYYNEMKRRGMQPSSKLQGLLISVLSREGHLQAAVEVRACDKFYLIRRPWKLYSHAVHTPLVLLGLASPPITAA